MSTLTINLSDEQLAGLKQVATRLGVGLEDAASQVVDDFLKRQRFQEAADYVLRKNEELYRRLAK
jgi:predicted transcriptional regulator